MSFFSPAAHYKAAPLDRQDFDEAAKLGPPNRNELPCASSRVARELPEHQATRADVDRPFVVFHGPQPEAGELPEGNGATGKPAAFPEHP